MQADRYSVGFMYVQACADSHKVFRVLRHLDGPAWFLFALVSPITDSYIMC